MRRFVPILLAVGLTAGCTTHLPRHQPYRDSIGRTLPLQREMLLQRQSGVRFGAPTYGIVPLRWDRFAVEKLPVGTPVTITSVVRWNGFDSHTIEAIGDVTRPSTGEKVRFSYLWGSVLVTNGATIALERAPWEDASVPEQRDVGWNGRKFRGK